MRKLNSKNKKNKENARERDLKLAARVTIQSFFLIKVKVMAKKLPFIPYSSP
jgi:hypothetical protein